MKILLKQSDKFGLFDQNLLDLFWWLTYLRYWNFHSSVTEGKPTYYPCTPRRIWKTFFVDPIDPKMNIFGSSQNRKTVPLQ